MAAAELVDELRDVLHPQSVSMRKVGETVVAVNLTLKYPLAMANLRQASLLLQEKHEALLHLDCPHSVAEMVVSSGCCWSGCDRCSNSRR